MRYALVILGILLVGAAVYFIRPEYRRVMDNTERAMDLIERLESIISINTDELKELQANWKQTEIILKEKQKEIAQLIESNSILQEKIQPIEIPDFSEIPNGCEEIAEVYEKVVHQQQDQIVTLSAINTNQGLIISRQQEIIESQSDHIKQLQEAHSIMMRRANRRTLYAALIALGVGLIAGSM